VLDLEEQARDLREDVDYTARIGKAVEKLSKQMEAVVATTQTTSSDVRDLKTRFDVELPNLAKKTYLLEKIGEHISTFHRRPSKDSAPPPCGYEVSSKPMSISTWLKVIIIAATALGTGLAAWYGVLS
jgi:hypothetical protein